MKITRPRTLLGMVLVGPASVTVPLLIAIGNAMIKIGQLAAESETVLSHSGAATVENQRLANFLQTMERNARQYLVLEDVASASDLLTLYDSDQAAFERSVTTLRALPNNPAMAEQLQRLAVLSKDVHRTLHGSRGEDFDYLIVERFRVMNSTARDVAQGMRDLINVRLSDLRENTLSTQRALAWQSAALIPGTLVLVVLFLLLVGRPMRQVDRAIRELGEGDFSRPITVSGPNDIETLGRQLEWLRHRLKESTDEKNKFLRHMSHELKTPLANIREGTELLLYGSVGPLDIQQQEVTGILRDNGLKLQKLIENLLTFSAWQTQTASLELTEFSSNRWSSAC
jgi:two-component system sensor histidine kinase GlrK